MGKELSNPLLPSSPADQASLEAFDNGGADGITYTGASIDGKRHGEGAMQWADGRSYTGQWQHGMRHGKGRQSYPDGKSYDGDWTSGKWNGRGKVSG